MRTHIPLNPKLRTPAWDPTFASSSKRFGSRRGVVLATEHKMPSILYDQESIRKVEKIDDHIGMTYSGMGIAKEVHFRFVS